MVIPNKLPSFLSTFINHHQGPRLIKLTISLFQMRQPDYGGMRNDPYYPPQQQQPMAAQPNPYGQGPDPYGQPQAQPAPYSYSTGAANPDMYSRR